MALKLVTPPEPAVTWEEAKPHLNLDTDEQKTLIESYIAAATSWIDGRDGWLGRSIMTQTWDLIYDAFPCGAIEMPYPPLQSIVGVYYLDRNGTEQTVPQSDYYVDVDSMPGWVVPTGAWPSSLGAANAVRVRFTAGYATVPPAIKVAILLIVAHINDNRGDAGVELPSAAKMLLMPYKLWRI